MTWCGLVGGRLVVLREANPNPNPSPNLVVDVLREVLTPLHPAHGVAPSLEESERAWPGLGVGVGVRVRVRGRRKGWG